ncbi:DNA replication/checkpoint protein [Neurospora tetraspora]|uniref:DNA replication regulator SLD2 n=1 Tax=Neurospora tetraspora TaxID=94610 RepID=A0AAE0JI22_9PEZI|nr:DNA replication/checkpoint protein [Neurospora tetraspora]
MDEQLKSEYESQSLQLRAELKQFEGEWAQNHDGKKPSREAIKQNPDIAQKYKQYNKLRDILSGKIPPPKSDNQDPSQRKRKQAETFLPSASTPSKRNKSAATPKSQHYIAVDEAITPEVARKLFSPAVPSSIGPTPQKDGRVLGLFDLISHTSSKSTDDSKPRAPGFTATPSKRRHALDLENDKDDDEKDDKEFITPSIPRHRNLDRTPSSGRNRNLLDSFLGVRATNTSTPLNKNNGNSPSKSYLNKTPSGERSVSKLQFATPAFLRRISAPLPPVDENGEWLDIEPLKLPRKPFSIAKGRGLSRVVASLRKMEEEKLDEELDMLREMEAMEQGEMGPPPPKKTVAPPREDTDNQKARPAGTEGGAAEEEANDFEEDEAALIEVEASFLESPSSKRKKERQRPVLLSGFDDENVYDSQDDGDLSKEGLDRNGQPLRVFKKKGQKRTTRKVNMRPTRTKRPSAPVAEEEDDDSEEEEEEEEDGDDVIPETQFDATKNNAAGDDSHNLDPLLSRGSGSEFDDDDDGSEGEGEGEDEEAEASTTKTAKAAKKKVPAKPKEKKKKDVTTKKTKNKKNGGKEDGDEEPVKKPRMVKATANANFKRLKLKNNGAKGGPAHNSRFRRRR